MPRFEWSAVEGAAIYRLAVLGPDDLPIWAWEGDTTSIYLGGLDVERPPGMRGPLIVPGSRWSVVAVDSGGMVIAISEQRPVSPGDE